MIHLGDCVEVMRTMPSDSVDAVVTDPPYGLEFMGKGWDAFRLDDPGTNRHRGVRAAAGGINKVSSDEPRPKGNPWQKEASGYGGSERAKTNRCVGCGKRDQFRNPHACPEGTPWKAELIDPYAAPPSSLAFQNWCRTWALEALRVTKPGGYLLAFGGTRTHHRLVCGLEDAGWIIRDELTWVYASGFPKGKANLKPAHEPIVLARKPGPLRALNIERSRISVDGRYTSPTSPDGPESSDGDSTDRTGPWHVDAQTLRSLSTRLRAWSEQSPEAGNDLLASAIADVVEGRGSVGSLAGCLPCRHCGDALVRFAKAFAPTGALQLGDVPAPLDPLPTAQRIRECRCAAHPSTWDELARLAGEEGDGWGSFAIQYSDVQRGREGEPSANRRYDEEGGTNLAALPGPRGGDAAGRWPSNLLLSDPELFDVANPGVVGSGAVAPSAGIYNRQIFGEREGPASIPLEGGAMYGDSGGYSRFFVIPKSSRSDREPVIIPDGHDRTKRFSTHPTQKPTDLMAHLIKLVTPPGGVILDPFLGSGSTAIAAERLGVAWIGIEKEPEYVAIAEARLNGVQRGMGLDVPAPTSTRKGRARPDSKMPQWPQEKWKDSSAAVFRGYTEKEPA